MNYAVVILEFESDSPGVLDVHVFETWEAASEHADSYCDTNTLERGVHVQVAHISAIYHE